MLILFAALAALSTSIAWLLPLTTYGAALAMVGVVALTRLTKFRTKASLLGLYCAGLGIYLFSFYWLAPTMQKFSGLPAVASGAFFGLFCLISALQFPLYGFLTHTLERCGMRIFAPALGWISAQELFFRIFPWTPAHPLIAIPEFVQVAYFISASGVTVLMFISSALIIKPSHRIVNLCLTFFLISTVWALGSLRLAVPDSARKISIAIIQGNISVEEKHSRELLYENVKQYFDASLAAVNARALDLVVWPETVLLDPLPVNARALPKLALPKTSLLFGALSYGPGEQFYNSAFRISPGNGSASNPYHKRILMPFGEYTPGSRYFPFLKELNQNAAEFAPGDSQTLIPIDTSSGSVSLSPLICYEDVVSAPANEAAQLGADVLVNMSNDGWFGDTVAAKQHHQIAAWRTVETGLPLIRATNTGYSAVVNYFGITIGDLPEHRRATLIRELPLGVGPARFGARQVESIFMLVSYIVILVMVLQVIRRFRPLKANSR